MSTYSDLYDRIIELTNPNTRNALFLSVSRSLSEAYKYASKKGIHESNAMLGRLSFLVEEIEERGLPVDYSEFLAKTFCELAFLDVEKDDFGAAMIMGWQGRALVEKHPTVALIIVDTLGKTLEKVGTGKGFEKLTTQYIKEQIESIQQWNKSNHQEIKEKVGQLLGDNSSNKMGV